MDFENTGKDLGKNKWENIKIMAHANTLGLTLVILIFFANMRGTVPISYAICAFLYSSFYRSLDIEYESFPDLIGENIALIIFIIMMPIWVNY